MAVMEDTVKAAVKAAGRLDCDIVELRLDKVEDASDLHLLAKIRKPVIATCMPKWEGGYFRGSEEERSKLLAAAIKYADYVSLEMRMRRSLRDQLMKTAHKEGANVILTYHDFKSTPTKAKIMGILRAQQGMGADIAKVAFMPKKYADVLNVMSAQVEAKLRIPVIALSMGELGRASRILSPMLGGYLTFASRGVGKGTAKGQYTLNQMKTFRRLLGG